MFCSSLVNSLLMVVLTSMTSFSLSSLCTSTDNGGRTSRGVVVFSSVVQSLSPDAFSTVALTLVMSFSFSPSLLFHTSTADGAWTLRDVAVLCSTKYVTAFLIVLFTTVSTISVNSALIASSLTKSPVAISELLLVSIRVCKELVTG